MGSRCRPLGHLHDFGQLALYDPFKTMLLSTGLLSDNPVTHFSASIGATGVATCMTQPFDIMKTRQMNVPPDKYSVGPPFVCPLYPVAVGFNVGLLV